MIGGLFKSASRLALVATAGILAGSVAAQAADLGGDCCADLEERVAELEATTVRKGNRKVSLQLSGQIHQSILFWDDGHESNTYVGVNNINSSSRFRFVGEAKINPEFSAGYLYEMETGNGSNSSVLDQSSSTTPNGSVTALGYALVTRHQAFWIDSKSMGRIWLGLTDAASAGINSINLANTAAAANAKASLLMGGFLLRNATTNNLSSGLTWGNTMGNNGMVTGLGEETRNNIIKYVSPTLMGFIFSASYGEDDLWDVALRYAGEFSGFKVAAGIGYAQASDGNGDRFGGCVKVAGGTDRDCSSLNVGASLMHVPTGLFVSGHYAKLEDDLIAATAKRDFDWHVMGGIEQNWTGLGKTTLFGEYSHHEGNIVKSGVFTVADANIGAPGAAGTATSAAFSDVTFWGLGLVQSIDAAALDLYIAYRNTSVDVTRLNGTATTNPITDFQTISVGGLIKF